ncbi:MAG: aspartate aminotransferase family protein [Haloarculaceae archaeon]
MVDDSRSTEPSMAGTERSARLHERALGTFPGGVSHNVRYFEPHPVYLDRAEGARVWDADGNEYVDFWMNHMASILGHSYPPVADAVAAQAQEGLHFGAPNEAALRLAELVETFVPSAERLRFCASGTEATMYAVRLARAATGRDHVLKVEGGWHGGNTDLSVGVSAPFDEPETAGLPPGAAEHVHTFPVNDRAAVERLLDAHAGDVAGVIIEPFFGGGISAEEAFLRFLKAESERREFLLVFDEVVTGFRFAPGSYGARVGIDPDLTTLGKILGGGLPVGAVAGRADLFEAARPDVDVPADERVLAGGGTFSMNPMTAAAGLATLEVLDSEPVYETVEAAGERVRTELSRRLDALGVDATVAGEGSLLYTHFGPDGPLRDLGDVKAHTDRAAGREFDRRLFEHGVYFLPGHMGAISYRTTDEQLDAFLDAAETVARGMQADGLL